MKYLLDTNVLSDARKLSHPPLNHWLETQQRASLAISVITVFEIELGILRLERRDRKAATHIRVWFEDEVKPLFDGRILSINDPVAVEAARLHVLDPIPDSDAQIAATATVHGLILVTRNAADFEGTGVSLLNPWDL